MKITVLILICLLVVGCANTKFIILGVDVKEVTTSNAGQIIGGAIVSNIVHVGGHYLAAGIFDVEIHPRGPGREVIVPRDSSNSDLKWVHRGGFALQFAINTALISFETTRKSPFTKGFVASTCLGLVTYPFSHPDKGDFHSINRHGGDASDDYNIFGAIAAYNFYMIASP